MKSYPLRILAVVLLNSGCAMGSTFTVTTTADAGPGTLRQAILDANATTEADVIEFNIPGPTPHTISPVSALPTISRSLTIDGTSQPGFAGRPIIELDGSALQNANGLRFTSGNCTIRGLVINRFPGTSSSPRAGVWIEAGGRNVVESNFIGTDLTGVMPAENFFGVVILNSANNLIGGTNAAARNVISGNSIDGIHIEGSGASANRIQGNFIGTDVTGTTAVPNSAFGVVIVNAPNNVVGGLLSKAGNVISGNNYAGVRIPGASSTGNRVEGNLVGTDVTGKAALGNGVGVAVHSGASNNTIGGTNTAARNVISGNLQDGVQLHPGGSTTRNRIEGNFIGTDVTGANKLANGGNGIALEDVAGNFIGGTNSAARNLISGNGANGIEIKGKASARNIVQGNVSGTDVSGTAKLGNSGHGISLIGGASNNSVGGASAGAANTIAFNESNGIDIELGAGNAVRANSIFANGKLALDLGSDGATANDGDDSDTGANNLQNSPVLTAATSAGGAISFQGMLKGAPNATFVLDFFANNACDAAGQSQGQRYLGSATVTSNAAGEASFSATVPTAVPAGQFVTSTATDASNNTSEFSRCLPVAVGMLPPNLSVARSGSGDTLILSWPAAFDGFVLEVTESLVAPISWTPITTTSTLVGDQNQVPVAVGRATAKFYRIRKR